jgi:serine/threonine protein kinase
MSKEQEQGGKYTNKTDMYSLGIILFEMTYAPYATDSERYYSLTELRKSCTFPSDYDERAGELAKEVKQIIV